MLVSFSGVPGTDRSKVIKLISKSRKWPIAPAMGVEAFKIQQDRDPAEVASIQYAAMYSALAQVAALSKQNCLLDRSYVDVYAYTLYKERKGYITAAAKKRVEDTFLSASKKIPLRVIYFGPDSSALSVVKDQDDQYLIDELFQEALSMLPDNFIFEVPSGTLDAKVDAILEYLE